jgi:FAD/FMN-containing dehydrogenase
MTTQPATTDTVIPQLVQLLGAGHVLTDPEELEYHAMDAYSIRSLPIAVVRPGTVAELQEVVRIAAAHGIALAPRGGAASYTDAHLPSRPDSLIVDTERLDRIVEINEQDMYVVVEPGVTWHDLWQALSPRRLRASFWGPFSGLKATVGGSASQNAASLGSGNYGITADAILGFEVVLASGELLSTGSAAKPNGAPFFRWDGPDLTGLFCGDSGALGIKARISLRLIRTPPCFGAVSFSFDAFDAMAAGMAAAARENVTADNFAVDPTLQQAQLGSVSTKDALAAAIAVMKSSRNPLEAGVRLSKMAMAGRRFLAGANYCAHYTVEGVTAAEVRGKLGVLRAAMSGHGQEIAATIPTVLRAMPFVPLYYMLGPKGERWVPLHGLIPFSRIAAFHERLMRLYADQAERMKRHTLVPGAMFTTINTHAFLYEPVFYWQDELTPYHRRYLPADYVASLPTYPANPGARALVRELRDQIQEIFASVGAVHMQIGKCYPYMDGRQAGAALALQQMKQHLDPGNIMNPGALQL